nr:hypothetical protein [Tanacetum cinerariifolium]
MSTVGDNGGNQFKLYAGHNVRNQNRYNTVQNVNNQVVQNAVQNLDIQNVRNHNGLIIVSRIANQNVNPNENGNVVVARTEGNSNGNNTWIQLKAEEFDLLPATCDLDEIKKVNKNYFLMANLQQASTSEEKHTELLEPISEPHKYN